MKDFDDPLDLLEDDGDGVVELSILEEEEKHKKSIENKNSGCCLVFLVLGSTLTIAGWCLGEYFSSGKCGVGIETYPEYQNKGYATLLASALVRHGQKRGLNIYWDSWKDNVPSIRVAEKTGFELICEYKVYFGSFDEFLNIIILGDIAYRQGNYEEAIKIYLQAVEMKPEENWLYWNIAVQYQKQRLTKQVFEYLHKAIDYGMTSFQQFENSPHFKDLHSLPEWKELISRLKRTK